MTTLYYPRSEGLSQNATTEWQDKINVAGPLPGGEYKVLVSLEYGGANTTRAVGVRILVDGEIVNEEVQTPDVANTPKVLTTFWGGALSEGDHRLQIQFRAEALPQTALIRRARAIIEKH